VKAAILEILNAPLVVDDVDLTELGVGQVRVKVLASGICGAQLQEIRGEKGGPLPHLLGHEGAGIVQEVGPGVSRLKVNDLVVMHWRPAGGIASAFPEYVWRGRRITSGLVTTFAEQSICAENRLTPVPPGTDPMLCCLLGCSLSTALATIETECTRFGESVLIIGCGGLGLALLAALDLVTPARVCACDVHERKRARVEQAGADYRNLRSDKIDGRFDLILDTAGDPAAMEDALEHLAPSGRYVMIGQPPPGRMVCIASARHMFDGEGKSIRATQGGGFRPDEQIPRYLKAAESLLCHNLITHRFPLARINEALDLVRSGEAGRVLLEMP
jgi:S-(hydroxymethyl)glutathione dehydrogenase/alcohol dehydrogenase